MRMMVSRLLRFLLVLRLVLVDASSFTPTRQCQEEFARVSVAQVQEVANLFVREVTTSDAVANLARDSFLQKIQYDVVVAKVCGSCKTSNNLSDDDDSSYSCVPGAPGYDATQSSVVLAALDPETNQIVTGETRGFLYRSGTQLTLEESPTEFFPTCMSTYVHSNSPSTVLLGLIDYLAPLVLASSGVIAVIPDTLGYGESHRYNRTYLQPSLPSVQAWTVSYLSAQQYIQNITGGCTLLATTTAVGGYGHGGYEAVIAAQALKALGINVFELYVGGGILKLPTQLSFLVQQLQNEAPPSATTMTTNEDDEVSLSRDFYLKRMTLLWSFSYSEQLPSLEWRERILQLSAPDPSVPIVEDSNKNLLEMIHPDIVDFFETARNQGSTNPCDTLDSSSSNNNVMIAALCQTMAENDITQTLVEMEIPTKFCHSPDDTVVTIDNLLSEVQMATNENLRLYTPPLAFLNPTGDHGTAAVACALDPITTYRITNLNQPLDNPPATCPSTPLVAAVPVCAATPPPAAAPTLDVAPNNDNDDDSSHGICVYRGSFISWVGLVVTTVSLLLMLL